MFSISSPSLFGSLITVKFGVSVSAVGTIGGAGKSVPPSRVAELSIPWHEPQDKDNIFQLLSWHTRLSELSDRSEDIEKLEEWTENRYTVSIKFLTGEGGVGKSRLAAEFAERLRSKGWSAGFVDLRKEQAFPMRKNGTLMLVDYPEENHTGVRELLRDLSSIETKSKIRVLFLTRKSIDNWMSELHATRAINLTDTKDVSLGGLDSKAAYRLYNTAFRNAVSVLEGMPLSAALGEALSPLTEEQLSDWISSTRAPENKRALFILAAAIHSALNPYDEVVRYSGKQVVQALVDREKARLSEASKDMGLGANTLGSMLAIAVIADKLALSKARELASSKKVGFDIPEGMDLERRIRTSGVPFDGVSISAPKPDILAAALVVSILSERPDIAGEIIWRGLEDEVDESMERLGRLCYDTAVTLGIHEHKLGFWLEIHLNPSLRQAHDNSGEIVSLRSQ